MPPRAKMPRASTPMRMEAAIKTEFQSMYVNQYDHGYMCTVNTNFDG